MPFFYQKIIKNKFDCVSLQVHKSTRLYMNNIKKVILITKSFRKRVYQFTSKGSLTIEAALATTIFIMIAIFILKYIIMINTQLKMEININNVAKASAKNAYYMTIADEAGSKSKTYEQIQSKINGKLNNENNKTLKGNVKKCMDVSYLMAQLRIETGDISNKDIELGYLGINGCKSTVNNGKIDIVISYKEKSFFNTYPISIMQRALVKDWSGVDISKIGTTVYITKNGTVYHISKECKFLNIHPKRVTYNQISILRNNSGGKYKKCNLCTHKKISDSQWIYITDEGNRYHESLECGALTRSVITTDLEQVKDKKPCSNCGG